MNNLGVDITAIREALKKATLGPWDIRKDEWGGGVDIAGPRTRSWRCASSENDADADLIVLLRNNAEALLDALERAQAASEGVDMLVAQAERRGAVKALRSFRDQFDSFDSDYDNAIVMAIADEDADRIENGANL